MKHRIGQRWETINRYFLYFVAYGIIGWCYEVFLEVVVYRWGFSNRGYLFGPWLPIYGTGALVFLLVLGKLRKQKLYIWRINITPLLLFLGAGLIATGIELGASYLLEWTTGGWMWDYSSYVANFEGRIALNPSIRFGLGGLLFLLVVQPRFEAITDRMSIRLQRRIGAVLMVLMTIDILVRILT